MTCRPPGCLVAIFYKWTPWPRQGNNHCMGHTFTCSLSIQCYVSHVKCYMNTEMFTSIVCSLEEKLALHWFSMESELFLEWTDYSRWHPTCAELPANASHPPGVHFHVHFTFHTTVVVWNVRWTWECTPSAYYPQTSQPLNALLMSMLETALLANSCCSIFVCYMQVTCATWYSSVP